MSFATQPSHCLQTWNRFEHKKSTLVPPFKRLFRSARHLADNTAQPTSLSDSHLSRVQFEILEHQVSFWHCELILLSQIYLFIYLLIPAVSRVCLWLDHRKKRETIPSVKGERDGEVRWAFFHYCRLFFFIFFTLSIRLKLFGTTFRCECRDMSKS